jgi:hypothetical protein
MTEIIDCPRAKTDMTPCIARDGKNALADDDMCVGCYVKPKAALRDLGTRYLPARKYYQTQDPDKAAERLKELVKEYVDDGEPRPRRDYKMSQV